MPRGVYGPIDRERHWVAAIANDEAEARIADAAIGAVAPAVHAYGEVKRGYYGAKRVVVGMQMLENRGQAGKGLHRLGADWFHSVRDRQEAVAQISDGFRAFMRDLATWHEQHPDPRKAMATAQWVHVDVLPAVREWNVFAEREKSSWWVRAATTWSTFVAWNLRLRRFRELARAHGIVLQSPEPPGLPETMFEQGQHGHGSAIAPWFGVAKAAFGGALAIAGGLTIYSIVHGWAQRRYRHDHPDAGGEPS